MKTYEDKKKMSENFPEGTKCLIEFESVKDKIVSHIEDGKEFTALIPNEKCAGISSKIKQSVPDLDTIMVYEERKGDLEDEEFTL